MQRNKDETASAPMKGLHRGPSRPRYAETQRADLIINEQSCFIY